MQNETWGSRHYKPNIGNDYTVLYLFIFKMADKTRSNNIYLTIQNTHRSDIQCSKVILHAVC